MNHSATLEQLSAASNLAAEVIQFTDRDLLTVPHDPNLPREWFTTRAEEIIRLVGGIQKGDVLHVMGQPQLAIAVMAAGRRAGARIVESIHPRTKIPGKRPFQFSGFRDVYEY